MRKLIAAFILLTLVFCVWLPLGRSAPPKKEKPLSAEVRKLMRDKLAYTQKVLEGVATENFDLIGDNVKKLNRLGSDRDWKVVPTIEYSQHSLEFMRAVDSLGKAAEEKNHDAVELAYLNMTMKCIYCHKYVRKSRMARAIEDGLIR